MVLHSSLLYCTSAILIALNPWKGLDEFLMAMLRGARLDTTCQGIVEQSRAVQERVGEGRGWIAGVDSRKG
jgi:hypothetical protein